MEENETPQPDYLKGFNEGYLMAKHLPDLAEKLAKADNESVRHMGFRDGRSQLTKEKEKTRYPDWLKSDRLDSIDKKQDKSKEKDRGDRERD